MRRRCSAEGWGSPGRPELALGPTGIIAARFLAEHGTSRVDHVRRTRRRFLSSVAASRCRFESINDDFEALGRASGQFEPMCSSLPSGLCGRGVICTSGVWSGEGRSSATRAAVVGDFFVSPPSGDGESRWGGSAVHGSLLPSGEPFWRIRASARTAEPCTITAFAVSVKSLQTDALLLNQDWILVVSNDFEQVF